MNYARRSLRLHYDSPEEQRLLHYRLLRFGCQERPKRSEKVATFCLGRGKSPNRTSQVLGLHMDLSREQKRKGDVMVGIMRIWRGRGTKA